MSQTTYEPVGYEVVSSDGLQTYLVQLEGPSPFNCPDATFRRVRCKLLDRCAVRACRQARNRGRAIPAACCTASRPADLVRSPRVGIRSLRRLRAVGLPRFLQTRRQPRVGVLMLCHEEHGSNTRRRAISSSAADHMVAEVEAYDAKLKGGE